MKFKDKLTARLKHLFKERVGDVLSDEEAIFWADSVIEILRELKTKKKVRYARSRTGVP